MQRSLVPLASILSLVLPTLAVAQSPRGTAKATIAGSEVTVEYGRPSLKGRDLLAQAPVSTVWRTGADTSTTFTTGSDVMVGGKTIPAGSYSLFTKRTGQDSWALVFNEQTGQWGTEHDPAQDFAEVPLQWKQDSPVTEQFTIDLLDGQIRLLWGKHVLSAPLKATS